MEIIFVTNAKWTKNIRRHWTTTQVDILKEVSIKKNRPFLAKDKILEDVNHLGEISEDIELLRGVIKYICKFAEDEKSY